MAKYIEKEAVIADLKEQVEKGRDTAECEATELVIQRFAEYIRAFPAADVQPVKRGFWRKTNDIFYRYCSVCGTKTDIAVAGTANFCPNCGADMRGGKNA